MFSLMTDWLTVTLYNSSSLSKYGVINVCSRPANSSRTNSFWGVTGLSRFWCFIEVIHFVSAVIHLNASLTHCSSETSCVVLSTFITWSKNMMWRLHSGGTVWSVLPPEGPGEPGAQVRLHTQQSSWQETFSGPTFIELHLDITVRVKDKCLLPFSKCLLSCFVFWQWV